MTATLQQDRPNCTTWCADSICDGRVCGENCRQVVDATLTPLARSNAVPSTVGFFRMARDGQVGVGLHVYGVAAWGACIDAEVGLTFEQARDLRDMLTAKLDAISSEAGR
jgi:hypothetical protein